MTSALIVAEIERVVQSVNEWDDRTSPDDYPEHLLITSEELADILRNFADVTLESLQRENEELRAMFTYLNENSALELVWQEVNGDPSECGWHLFRRFGGRSDRDFKVVGTGETVEQAITLAMERAYE